MRALRKKCHECTYILVEKCQSINKFFQLKLIFFFINSICEIIMSLQYLDEFYRYKPCKNFKVMLMVLRICDTFCVSVCECLHTNFSLLTHRKMRQTMAQHHICTFPHKHTVAIQLNEKLITTQNT